jgi:hypothetical protein
MSNPGTEPEGHETPIERPDSDDYDLLTFGEVAARLAELLASEREALAQLKQLDSPDSAAEAFLELRIQSLEAQASRYRQQQHSNDIFAQRFGPALQAASAQQDKPDWN